MCTVIIHVPDNADAPTRMLAVRDEDPVRAWDPPGPWWPDAHPGVRGVRDRQAGGAWLAVDPATRRAAVILNRLDHLDDADEYHSRGGIVLDAVAGTPVGEAPDTRGFNLVTVAPEQTTVTTWDGLAVRTVRLAPGVHMIAHDDVDDPNTARVVAWADSFQAPATDAEAWWEPWIDALERSATIDPGDDRAIIRDNRPHGYPTQSLLVCAVSIPAGPTGTGDADIVYGELDRPGVWNRPVMR